MIEYRITSFRPEHLVPVLQLFAANYEKERNQVSALPPASEVPAVIQPRLADLVAKSPACVALRDNTLCGYMTGIPGLKNFKGTHNGVFIPEWAHSADGSDRIAIYARMYDHLAGQWVAAGNHTHAISIFAHDGELQNYWFRHAFGLEVIDAVLTSKPSSGPEIPGLGIIRANRPKDAAAFIQMRHELRRHLASAPVFLPMSPTPDIRSLRESNTLVFMAYHNGCPAGYMMAQTDADGVAAIVGGSSTLSISGAYVRPQFRQMGIATALLQKIIESGEAQGVFRIGVDFESTNDSACGFWQKHFTPVCHSCVRHVDNRRTSSGTREELSPEEIGQVAGRAGQWARQWLGKTEYCGKCLAFVEDALEEANQLELFGGDTAAESADIYEADNVDAIPPCGALVFYDWEGELCGEFRNWGHVGLMLDGGQVIHAWDKVRIDDYTAIADLSVPPGSTPLRYRGWAPLQRILLGFQRQQSLMQ